MGMYDGPAMIASAIADKRTGDAMNTLTDQALQQQMFYDQKRQGQFMEALNASGSRAVGQDLNTGRQQAMEGYKRTEATPLSLTGPTAGENTQTVRNNIKGRQDVSNQAQAANQAYAEPQTQAAVAQMLARARANLIGEQANNIASALPLQLKQAQTSTDPKSRAFAQGESMSTSGAEMYGSAGLEKGASAAAASGAGAGASGGSAAMYV